LTGRLADAVVAPSRKTAEELRRDYGLREVHVIANGVAMQPRPAVERDPRALVYVGRLRTRKAVAVLVAAVAVLRDRGVEATLEIIGRGEQEEALRGLVDHLELGDRVRFSGSLPRDEVALRCAAASVFCLPSTYEGLPLAILEAMSQGTAVVSTTVSGTPEAVEHGVTGLLVPPVDVRRLAEALTRLLESPGSASAMGKAGRARFEAEFTIGGIVRRHLELFAAVSERGPDGRSRISDGTADAS
jgi:glycosyltransferase involved in cell wall biosynthesis